MEFRHTFMSGGLKQIHPFSILKPPQKNNVPNSIPLRESQQLFRGKGKDFSVAL
jgi:hypothetical protein